MEHLNLVLHDMASRVFPLCPCRYQGMQALFASTSAAACALAAAQGIDPSAALQPSPRAPAPGEAAAGPQAVQAAAAAAAAAELGRSLGLPSPSQCCQQAVTELGEEGGGGDAGMVKMPELRAQCLQMTCSRAALGSNHAGFAVASML